MNYLGSIIYELSLLGIFYLSLRVQWISILVWFSYLLVVLFYLSNGILCCMGIHFCSFYFI